MADDPQLTTRLKRGKGKDPLRIVVETRLRIPPKAKVLNHDSSSNTIIAVGADVVARNLKAFRKKGVSMLTCPTKVGKIDLAALMGILGDMEITSLLVEGGASLIGSLLKERLVDKFFIFKAPKILGGDDGQPMAAGQGPKRMDQCLSLRDLRTRRYGDDILLVGYPDYGERQRARG